MQTNENHMLRILVVEDDRTTQALLVAQVQALGYQAESADNGKQALSMLQADAAYDIVLLDRQMPEMNGIELVHAMKGDAALRKIPVIMQTGMDRPDDVREGINAGVFYYLTKPVDEELLKSVLEAAIRDVKQQAAYQEEILQQRTSLRLMNAATFQVRTLDEAESLACMMAGCYKYPDRVVLGLAELMVNAVEHGNFAIGYEEKTRLIEEARWREEIDRRAMLPEYRDKYVQVTLKREQDMVSVTIADQGDGFDWQRFMEIDPARMLDTHGRGIAQANALSFDHMEYNNIGNQVTARVSDNTQPDW